MSQQHPLIAKVASSGPFTTSRSAQLQTQSAFFTILNEDVRNQIYEYLFGCSTIKIDPFLHEHHYDTSLLGTCQRAYMEGTRILYTTNVFNFGEEISLDIWGNGINVQRWDLIRKVDLRIRLAVDLWLWEGTWQVLQVMPCLRSAKLRCEEGIEEVYDWESERIVRGVQDPFKRTRFFLPWALRPMLWLSTSNNNVSFEITFNVERRKTLEVLIKELRAREIRGIRIGWVTKLDGMVECRPPTVSGAEEIRERGFTKKEDLIEWENV